MRCSSWSASHTSDLAKVIDYREGKGIKLTAHNARDFTKKEEGRVRDTGRLVGSVDAGMRPQSAVPGDCADLTICGPYYTRRRLQVPMTATCQCWLTFEAAGAAPEGGEIREEPVFSADCSKVGGEVTHP